MTDDEKLHMMINFYTSPAFIQTLDRLNTIIIYIQAALMTYVWRVFDVNQDTPLACFKSLYKPVITDRQVQWLKELHTETKNKFYY